MSDTKPQPKNDGGPETIQVTYYPPTLSLRDYFAAAAMTGFLADKRRTEQIIATMGGYESGPSVAAIIKQVSATAYQFADAMLAARTEGGAL